jgi:hypothetical protein
MGSLVDIINKEAFTGDYWEKAGKDMLVILERSAAVFVEDNKEVALGLTEEEVKGILFNAMFTTPSLPNIPEDATPVQMKACASILKARACAFALTMEAQRSRNVSTVQLQSNAKEFAIAVSKSVLGVLLGAASGMIL